MRRRSRAARRIRRGRQTQEAAESLTRCRTHRPPRSAAAPRVSAAPASARGRLAGGGLHECLARERRRLAATVQRTRGTVDRRHPHRRDPPARRRAPSSPRRVGSRATVRSEGDPDDSTLAGHPLRRAPSAARADFSLAVIATLALTIGATTAVFTVVNAVLLRGLPYRDPSRLVLVQLAFPQMSLGFSPPITWRSRRAPGSSKPSRHTATASTSSRASSRRSA